MKHKPVKISLGLSAVAVMGMTISLPASAASLYSLTDLGSLGGSRSQATGINNLGQVVGDSSTAEGFTHAFRTAANTAINPATDDLGTLSGLPNSTANGINDLGQVVGYSYRNGGESNNTRAFRTAANSAINSATDDLGSLYSGGDRLFTAATGINNSGQVVGASLTADGSLHAFRTAANSTINPATDNLGGGFTVGLGINNSGQVIGSATLTNSDVRAFRTAPNSALNLATDDLGTLGTLGSSITMAYGINNSGQVVGASSGRAFRTAPNSKINPATDNLGTLLNDSISSARGINNLGQVVGYSGSRAFLYDGSGQLIDLNSLINPGLGADFSVLTQANAINDLGQIVGFGTTTDGSSRAFLATPVPEPSSTLLNALAFGAVLGTGLALKRKG